MFTPAIRASSTSLPPVRRLNASSTQVELPPSLYRLPLLEAITTGFAWRAEIAGAWPNATSWVAPSAAPASNPFRTRSRRLIGCMPSLHRPLELPLTECSAARLGTTYNCLVTRSIVVSLWLISVAGASPGLAEDWPQFRGPTGQGISTERRLPLEWSDTRNIIWKTEVPGLGWSSPVVAAGRIWLTTATTEGGGSL